jgi:poly(3-hydroxybutyrate) depolymerase
VNRLIEAFVLSTVVILASVHSAAAEPMQLVVNGQTRTFVLERPAAPGPRPTIILLHGAGGSAAREAQSDLGRLAPQAGFVAVFPDGRGARWNHLPPGKESAQFVQVFREHGGVPDDVAFLKALVSDLVRRGISDPKRVYLAGVSAGGVMTLRMVCLGDGIFAAIALMAASMPDATGADCRLPAPLPVLMIHGTADNVMPYGGGFGQLPDGKGRGVYSVWPVERVVGFFRQHNGCAAPAEKSVLPGSNLHKVEVERSSKCSGGRVAYYRIVGGGHNIRPQIPTASQLFLDFFRDSAAPAVAATPGQPSVAGGAVVPPSTSRPALPPTSGTGYEDSYEQAFAEFPRAQLSYPPAVSPPHQPSRPAPHPTLGSDYESSYEQALDAFRKTQPSGSAISLPSSRPAVIAPVPTPGAAANAPRPASPPVAAPLPAGPSVAALPPATAPTTPQARVALVIGNANYRHATRLANPAHDATDIAQALRRLGFDVIEGRNLDKRGMEDKVREFGRKLDRADLALFFYAGHGIQVAGRNYLIPVDAKLERPGDLNFDTLDVSIILAQMEAEQRVNLVFLDACRDNPLARSFARSLGTRSASVGQGLATMHGAVGTLIAFATGPDTVALDGEGRNSSISPRRAFTSA